MRADYQLSLGQEQRLILTPELRQALTILQLPALELEAYAEAQVLENPLLEFLPTSAETAAAAATDPPPAAGVGRWEGAAGSLAQWLDYAGADPGRGGVREAEEDAPEVPAPPPSLSEHLLSQLGVLGLEPAVRRAADFIVHSLDRSGYLNIGPAEVAALLTVDEAVARAALTAVQGLDPPGIGARDLQECLTIQWRARWPDPRPGDPAALLPALIARHLPDLAAGWLGRVARALGVVPEQVQAALDLLRQLSPRPGAAFGGQDSRSLVPDVAVRRVGADLVVLVNDAPGARLTLTASYRTLIRQGAGDPECRRYLEERLRSARWLIRCVEQRRLTLHRVVEAIAVAQQAFFTQGFRHLRPLTLREVAGAVGLHESTVSRAVAGKYLETPFGVMPLKRLFAAGVENAQGTGMASTSVKRWLQEMIQAEDPAHPLSDQALADALIARGIQISRRTVAKYREEAGIAPSPRRRRY